MFWVKKKSCRTMFVVWSHSGFSLLTEVSYGERLPGNLNTEIIKWISWQECFHGFLVWSSKSFLWRERSSNTLTNIMVITHSAMPWVLFKWLHIVKLLLWQPLEVVSTTTIAAVTNFSPAFYFLVFNSVISF